MSKRLHGPAELRSWGRSLRKRFCRKGQTGPPDWGPAAPAPWHCISHKAQSSTPEEHPLNTHIYMQLENKSTEFSNINTNWQFSSFNFKW